jgi:hypothetical protein
MDRRRFLAATTALLPVAGCLGPGGQTGELGVAQMPTVSLSMEAVEDADVARKVTHHEMSDEERQLLDRVVEAGSLEVGWHQTSPLHTAVPTLHGGAVYRLSERVVDTRPAVEYGVKVDVPQETPDEAATVQFADLPAADQAVFERPGLAGGDLIGVGTVVTYTPGEEAASVLVPDPEYDYVDWADGGTAEWVVDDRWETEQHRYRLSADRVASAAAYGRQVRENYGFDLSGLSDAEGDVVETAIAEEHGYAVPAEETPSPAVDALVDRFREREEVAANRDPGPGVSGTYVVRYETSVYWTRLQAPEDTPTGSDDG